MVALGWGEENGTTHKTLEHSGMFTTAHGITPTRHWPLLVQLVIVAMVWVLYPRLTGISLTLCPR